MLFCTGYIGKQCQIERYDLWIDHYLPRLEQLRCERMVIIDDGSPLEYVVKLGIPIVDVDDLPDVLPGKVCWIRFPDNLGRPLRRMIPGWWRSFSYASVLAMLYGAERLIHIESDAFVLSDKLFDWLAEETDHWRSLYSKHYHWPETAVQVIPKRSINQLFQFFNAGKEFWYGQQLPDHLYIPEYCLPIAEVNRWDFKGDRVGEDWCEKIPDNLDYVCNMNDVSTGRVQHRKQEAKMKWLACQLRIRGEDSGTRGKLNKF
jgi:hypothetical protein